MINENDSHYFYMYDQPITACYYRVIEKTNSATASKRTCCFACVRGRSYRERKGEKNKKKVICTGIVTFSMV